MVVLLGMAAFSIDIGYIALTKTELQNAADSAAMAAASIMNSPKSEIREMAKDFANSHRAGGQRLNLTDSDIEFGYWNIETQQFTPDEDVGNALRITARRNAAPHFFGKIFGRYSFDTNATAIAMVNPRDIVFVVDLSGSMNDDSEPCWATLAINNEFGEDHPGLGDDVAQQLFDDFNFGTFPGTTQHIGQSLVTANSNAYYNLTRNSGALSSSSIPSTYRISSSDSSSTRKSKCYRWIIDNQLASLMPAAQPAVNSTTNYNYWAKYLDYVIYATTSAPPNQGSMRMSSLANPNTTGYTEADPNSVTPYLNKIGYRTYAQFMLDHGRDVKPDGVNYTPLSVRSPHCPMHSEVTAGGTFSFPPREQPTHSSRRAIIAAIQVIKERNQDIPDSDQRDWVSIVTFDSMNDGGPQIIRSLTGDYDAAMQAVTTIQGVADAYYSTGTESGLILAKQHLQPQDEGGAGRRFANKVVMVLTDGAPNLAQSDAATVSNYVEDNPSGDFYSPASTPHDAALMQAMEMQLTQWQVFGVGIGLGTDYNFMDRLARIGGTANDAGESPRGSGNPAEYEDRTAEIFENIISNPKQRLVQ
jgi:Flp pilus assembly protein TadG